MLELRIQQHFIDSADLKYHAAQPLCGPIADGVQALLACVTSGGKVLACGHGVSASLAQQFVSLFVGSFERERPELGALALTADGALLSDLARGNDGSQVFARQLRALGQVGDMLLLVSHHGNEPALVQAVETAHERDMSVLALTGSGGGIIGGMLYETDVHICVPHERPARIHEVHSLTLHCLCDGVDVQLLGEQED